ncbi:parallel beta-helix domain-containing protein [Panacagrimonas sp.]|uniref:parallel beta-helix domain-containing protein n=1 Tax=Panacagrimonas sp. TaxID=2480088 RepID=UPI003B520537
MKIATARCILVAFSATLSMLAGCGGSTQSPSIPPGAGDGPVDAQARTYAVCDPATTSRDALIAFFDAREGDTIEFCAGRYELPTGLIVSDKRGITIKGAGRDRTILSFKNSDSAEGINATRADGLVIQGLTVEDTPGNGIRIFRSQQVVLRDVRARWRDAQGRDETQAGYAPSAENGAYGLYPVESRHVLMEDCEAHGASDAGIYVGQTSDVLVRRCLATYNVAGYEFENTFRAVFEDNVATRNTGGFLVFDLPDLRQYGAKNVVRRNRAFDNNTDNFAPVGNIVGLVPRGTGMLILASDQLEIYDNQIHDHDTLGIAVINYGLADPNQPDPRYDFFPEGIEIRGNAFRDNGGNVQLPSVERGEASLLPLLLKLKNLGRSAHIVWDGAEDAPNDCTQIPRDADGVPLDQPNSARAHEEQGGRSDERGRPNVTRDDPDPGCKWNAWKFEPDGALKQPENGLCVATDNTFENTRLSTLLTTEFLRANITSSDPAQLVLDLLKPASTNLTPHRCDLPARADPVLDLPFLPDPTGADARPDPAVVEAACTGGSPGQVNRAALDYNCPRLDQYGLFADAADPTRNANGGGVPYELNSALFSDYSSKYRFLFIPPGQQAVYRDRSAGATETLDFPVGTVIAKTFAFRREDGAGNLLSQDVVETRLLIKRQQSDGSAVWGGLPYVWSGSSDARVAQLQVEGGSASVTYDYLDPDPEVRDAGGNRKRYTGAVAAYRVPAALNCLTCHAGDDREAGSAPIGPKARLLNRDHSYAGMGVVNQLQYLRDQGLLSGLPADIAMVDRSARWNVPGSSGELPDSAADVHARARAYLEVNCMHCHQPAGSGSNSGLFLDAYRTVDVRYGICKKPVAAGRGSGGKRFDIIPGDSAGSILPFRMASAAAGVKMPPIARSVVHGEAVAMIDSWVQDVLPTPDTEDEEVCTGLLGGGLGGLALSVPEVAKAYADAAAQLKSDDQRRAQAQANDAKQAAR